MLKKKINEIILDTSIVDELEKLRKLLEQEREEKENVLKTLDEMKLRVQKLDQEIKLFIKK